MTTAVQLPRRIAAIVLLFVTLLGGCTEAPRNLHLIIDDSNDVAAFGHEALQEWIDRCDLQDSACFCIWEVSPDCDTPTCMMSIGVPADWGDDVMDRQEQYISNLYRYIRSFPNAEPASFGLKVAGSVSPADTRDVILEHRKGSRPVLPDEMIRMVGAPLNVTVVLDRSSSMRCQPDSLGVCIAYDWWYPNAASRPGSTFRVILVGRRDGDARETCYQHVSESASSGEAYARCAAARGMLARMARCGDDCSAILDAVNVAARRLREENGIKVLILLSDLRERNQQYDFEDTPLPKPEKFCAWLRSRSLMPKLPDVEVVVAGSYDGPSEKTRSRSSTDVDRLQAIWAAMFKEMGITKEMVFHERLLDKYLNDIVD